MSPKKYYEWERFWCPSDGSYSLDNNGFLVDPKSEWGKYYENSTILAFEEIPETSCVALLGEPGIGKTKALENAFNSFSSKYESKSLRLDLRLYTTDIGLITSFSSNPLISDWINSGYELSLFLDSLDEGLLNLNTMAAVLIEVLKGWPRKRLHLKIACRTSDWPKLFDVELPLLFDLDKIPKYEMLPLRAVDVKNAAISEEVDPKLFVEAILDAEVAAFANRPITLNFLLNLFKLKGALPEYKSEIYRLGCLNLCEEKSLSRLDSKNVGKLSATQKIVIAARIAAVMMFSKKHSILIDVNKNFNDEDLTIPSLLGFFEKTYGNEFFVNEEAIKETLGTALFNSRGDSRMGFSHQTFLEYLAAYYLIQKHVPLQQILNLITVSNRKIIPQLAEVAIWLAALSSNVFNALFEAQPEVLLRTSKEAFIDKRKVLLKLLSFYENGTLVDHYTLLNYFNRLKYPDMAAELRPYISDRFNLAARRVAILVARECIVNELADDLVLLALNQEENYSLRGYAAHAVSNLGNDKAQIALLPLALNEIKEDVDDELKGAALKAVWGKLNDIGELLDSLRPVQNENLIGTYYHFLSYDFADLIRPEHIAQTINWILERKISLGNEILENNMHQKIMLKAWNYLEDEKILIPFSKLALKRLVGHQEARVYVHDDTYTKKLSQDVTKRQALVKQMVELMKNNSEAFYLSYNPPFLFVEDIDWVIENIKKADPVSKREIWAQLLYYLVDVRDQDVLSKAYLIYTDYPEIKKIFSGLFEAIEINSALAQTFRDYEVNIKRAEQVKSEKLSKKMNSQSQLMLYIDQFNNGDIDAWWKLNLLILDSDPDKSGNEFDVDLTSFAIWESVGDEVRDELLLMAMKYLNQHAGGDIYRDEGKTYYRPAISGFRALYLIATKRPEVLETISVDVWNKWASVIVSYPVFSNKVTKTVHQILVSQLIQHSKQSFYELLQKQMDKEEKTEQYLGVLDLLEHLDTEELQSFLVENLEARKLNNVAFGQLITFLLRRNNLKAKQIAIEVLQLDDVDDDFVQRKIQTARSLMLYSNDGAWQEINSQIKKDISFGEKLFLQMAYERHGLANMLVNKFPEKDIVELYTWLETIFPEANDPHVAGMHEVTDRENVGQIRDSLLPALAEKGSNQARLSIEFLMAKYPEKEGFLYYLRRCEEKILRNNWVPEKPYVILEITRNSYRDYTQSQRTLQNYVLGGAAILAALLIDFLLNTFNYDQLIFFKSHQMLVAILIFVLTVTMAIINFNRPISD